MKKGLRKGYDFSRLSKTYAMLFISSVTNMASYSGDSKLFLHYLQVSRNPVLLHDFAVLIDIKGILINALDTCPSEIAIALLFYSHFCGLESTFPVRVYNNSILLFWLFFSASECTLGYTFCCTRRNPGFPLAAELSRSLAYCNYSGRSSGSDAQV